MSKTAKWITGIAAVICYLAALALAGIWRLGLLPLLLPPTLPAQPATASIGETIQPSGEISLTLPNVSISNEHPGNTPGAGTALPAPGKAAVEALPAVNTQITDDWAAKSQLEQEIDARYITRLSNLGNDYEDQLNSLIGEAYNEYASDKKQGKPISALALAGKYIPMGNALEKQCDSEFYALLDQFKDELQSNGLPLTTAARAQQVYEYDKSVRKKEILDAAAKLI